VGQPDENHLADEATLRRLAGLLQRLEQCLPAEVRQRTGTWRGGEGGVRVEMGLNTRD
jgi:hypothetical protein